MNIYEAQSSLLSALSQKLQKFPGYFRDNILPPMPDKFPFIAVDPDSASLTSHNGGTLPPQRFNFDIYVAVALASHQNQLSTTRNALATYVDSILAIPRLYASSVVYGEDVIGTTRCSLAKIVCSYPY